MSWQERSWAVISLRRRGEAHHYSVYRALAVALVVVIACATASRDLPGGDSNGNGDSNVRHDGAVQMDANNCATQPCDILSQCGCGSGACDIDGSDLVGTACRMITTPGHAGDACGGPGDCDKDFVCLGGSGDASCHKYCASTADCTSPRGMCIIDITNGTNPIQGVPPACTSNCDPLDAATPGCATGLRCSIFSTTHMGSAYNYTDCEAVGTGTQGTNCKVGTNGDDTLCKTGFFCTTVNGGANFNCRKYCTLNPAGGQCTGGLTCLAFNPILTVVGVEYGVCN